MQSDFKNALEVFRKRVKNRQARFSLLSDLKNALLRIREPAFQKKAPSPKQNNYPNLLPVHIFSGLPAAHSVTRCAAASRSYQPRYRAPGGGQLKDLGSNFLLEIVGFAWTLLSEIASKQNLATPRSHSYAVRHKTTNAPATKT